MCVWKSVLSRCYLGLTINTYTPSMHTQLFHPLSSINTSSVRVIQQINHHGYSNIIIAVLEAHSDWWCLWDHLNVSNEKSNSSQWLNDSISDWRLFDLLSRTGRFSSISITLKHTSLCYLYSLLFRGLVWEIHTPIAFLLAHVREFIEFLKMQFLLDNQKRGFKLNVAFVS